MAVGWRVAEGIAEVVSVAVAQGAVDDIVAIDDEVLDFEGVAGIDRRGRTVE